MCVKHTRGSNPLSSEILDNLRKVYLSYEILPITTYNWIKPAKFYKNNSKQKSKKLKLDKPL